VVFNASPVYLVLLFRTFIPLMLEVGSFDIDVKTLAICGLKSQVRTLSFTLVVW
jgi:hypothetical protein